MKRLSARLCALFAACAVFLGAPGPRAYAALIEAAGVSAPVGVSAFAAGSPQGAAAPNLGGAPALVASVPGLSAALAPSAFAAPAAEISAGALGVAGTPAAALAAAAPTAAFAAAPALSADIVADAVAAPTAASAAPSRAPRAAAGATRALRQTPTAEAARLFDGSVAGPAAALPTFAAAADEERASTPKDAALAPAPKNGKTKLPRSLWGMFIGHDLLTVSGIELHMISQPFLVMNALKKSLAVMGFVRNVHMGSMSLVNLLPVGLLIDKTDFRVLFISMALARAALMGSIPILFMTGHLSFAVLVGIIAINPLFQSTMIVADGAARMSFLGKDEKLNKEASAILGKWSALVEAIVPLAAGATVAALVSSVGMGGYALAYGVYAGLLLASIPFYWLMVRDERDHSEMGLAGFLSFVRGSASFLSAFLKALLLSPLSLFRALLRLARRGGARAPVEPGLGWKERLARAFDGHEAAQGFSYILRNKVLSTLIGVGAVEAFLGDAMPFVVLPNFIKVVVGPGPHFAIPVIGGMLATAGGIFGLLLGAESFGRFLSSWRMEGDRGDRLIEKLGHGRFYRMAAVSSLLFWLTWAVPTFLAPHMFWIALGTMLVVQFGMQLFHAPVGIVMAPIVRREIDDTKLGRVESAFAMVDMMFSAGGALAAGFLLDWLSLPTAMAVIASCITLTAVLEWLVPRWIFPDGNHPAKKDSV